MKKGMTDEVTVPSEQRKLLPDDVPSGDIQVERAIADFRAGYPVIIGEGEARFVTQGIENLLPKRLELLENFAQGKARLVLSSARIKRFKVNHSGVGSILLTKLKLDEIYDLALENNAETAKMTYPICPPVWVDSVALELTALSLVVPAAIVIPIPFDMDVDPKVLKVQAEDIRRYRRQRMKRMTLVSRAPVPLEGAKDSEFIVFRGGEGLRDQVAIIVGKPDISNPVSVRLHSACLTGDLFGSLKCDCGDQLRTTVQYMAKHEGGILLYLDQEGRGNGIANKIRAYNLQAQGFDTFDADEVIGFGLDQRRFDFAAEILRQLGVTKVRLLTNNPLKISALKEAGIDVVSDIRVMGRMTSENSAYLEAKRDRAGHLLDMPHFAHCPQKED